MIARPSRGTLWRLAVALSLTAFVIWRVRPAPILDAFGRTDLRWVAAALGLVLIDRLLMAWRWIVLLRTLQAADRPPVADILRLFFISTFVGNAVPGSVGSDVLRAYGLARANVPGAASIASVLLDRLLGVIALFAMIVAGLLLSQDLLHDRAVMAGVVLLAACCVVGLAAIYSETTAAVIGALLGRIPLAAARKLGTALTAAVRAYAAHHTAMATVLAGSIVVQILRVVQAYALGRAIGIDAGLVIYFAFVPIILLLMLLPISLYGLGTSQVAFPVLFARAGVPEADAFTLSLLFAGLGIVGNLPGAFVFLTGTRRAGREERA